MDERDWEDLEEEILTALSNYGLAVVFEDCGEDLTRRFVNALKRQFRESEESSNDSDD